MWSYINTDELYHYGVIGMKWGKRRAERKRSDRLEEAATGRKLAGNYKSGVQRKADARISKIQSKADAKKRAADKYVSKLDKRANETQKITKKTEDAVNSLSAGKKMARALVLGNYGGLVYTSELAKGSTKGSAFATAFMNSWGNNVSFGRLARTSTL